MVKQHPPLSSRWDLYDWTSRRQTEMFDWRRVRSFLIVNTMVPNHSIQWMRASRSGQLPFSRHQRLALTADAGRYMSRHALQFWLMVVTITLCGCTQKAVLTSSMSPTIKPGAKITVDWTAYVLSPPKRWDVVCFEPPTSKNQIWAMRVVGLPGETVSFGAGGIAINGRSVAPPSNITNVVYVSVDHPALRGGGVGAITSPYVVPSNCFFVLGDNSTNALDSRFWGAVQRTNIFGRVRGV
jgi:signal peptidase I